MNFIGVVAVICFGVFAVYQVYAFVRDFRLHRKNKSAVDNGLKGED